MAVKPTRTDNSHHARATRIVERVLPPLPACNPLHDPEGFVAASKRQGEASRLYWEVFARLRAKAEGGAPRIDLPKHCEHLFGPGAALFEASRKFARLPDADLQMIVRGHKVFDRTERRTGGRAVL